MYNMNISLFGYKMNVMSLLFFAVIVILISHTYYGSYNNPYALIEGLQKKEGFVGANTNYGESSIFNVNSDVPVNTSNWSQPNLVVIPGQPLDPAVKKFLERPKQPVPLPNGEMDLFYNTPFKPECCPNTYSNSTGCACMTGEQYNYLIQRGNNNVPYSEY